MPIGLIHITAAFSNAVLVAIMPGVNDFAKKLDLPIPIPITTNQVSEFRVNPIQGMVGGGLWLTNKFWFDCENGCVAGFRSPDNFFYDETFPLDVSKYTGKDNMTTNDAVELARGTLQKLGYEPKTLYADVSPFSVKGPFETKDGHHIPYCEIRWSHDASSEADRTNSAHIEFQINMEKKSVVGMDIVSPKIWRPNPQIDVTSETEAEFRKRNSPKMFVRSNTPPTMKQR